MKMADERVASRLANTLRELHEPGGKPQWDVSLFKQKQAMQARQRRDNIWKTVVDATSKQGTSEVRGTLRGIRQVVLEMIGQEVDAEVIDDGASFLLNVFHNIPDETALMNANQDIRAKFGQRIPHECPSKAYSLYQKLVSLSKKSKVDIPSLVLSEQKNKSTSQKSFGENIKFSLDCDPLSNFIQPFREATKKTVCSLSGNNKITNEVAPKDESVKIENEQYWLKRQIELVMPESPMVVVEELCVAIYKLLASKSNNDLIQNDLFDLLGFERFELIAEILAKRSAIVTSATQKVNRSGDRMNKKSANRKGAPGPMVSVQTAEEKQLHKQLVKEGKKKAKKEKGESHDVRAALGFDTDQMLQSHERALEESKKAPLFKTARRQVQREIYPNVYDSFAAAASNSFVGGMKLLLPEGAEKLDFKFWERVSIPPSKSAAQISQERRVPITELSSIAQLAFKGVKALNRVQSIVYSTAYKTNENLLICAPTGAGKTNVAMMTILRCIEQHVEMGVIQKNKFKIVYVAPMKALAAEMVANFGAKLQPLGLSVRELTGDMQMTKTEIVETNMIVTTPEKWDVITRKSTGDVALTQLVKLLIIDEVHLLHDERGSVIESLVARTLRLVESQQSMIRIVGLSATLPNYVDAADFLRVGRYLGMFYFDSGFRPVPLHQNYIGVKGKSAFDQMNQMDESCFEVVSENVFNGHQVMVFVHARNATSKTALRLRDIATRENSLSMFQSLEHSEYGVALKAIQKSHNKELKDVFKDGFATHHAGMSRSDRNMVEKYFSRGVIKVLVCTATLAWGVNLPAHAVVIKGTQLYSPDKGGFVDLGVLDVQQIFGRAGRPQFDTLGEATMITTHDKLSTYLTLMTNQTPIESQFISRLADNLNAEVVLGTVTNIDEGVQWLSYTYLFPRMKKNPLAYGIDREDLKNDPELVQHRSKLITFAASSLDKARMIRFNEVTGYMHATDLGRAASHYYIKLESMEIFNDNISRNITEADLISVVSQSSEFEQIKVREEEMDELSQHYEDSCMLHPIKGGVENPHGKTNILLQTYITGSKFRSFSLSSDSAYVAQNFARILRGLLDISMKKNWASLSFKLLNLCKQLDKRIWGFLSPLRQFNVLDPLILKKIENARLTIPKIMDMEVSEIGHLVHHVRMGRTIKNCALQFPSIRLHVKVQPITRTVLRVTVLIEPDFTWNSKIHGMSEPWWIWVEDPENEHMYHSEMFQMRKEQVMARTDEARCTSLTFTIPIFEPLPSQYIVRAVSERWIGAESAEAISFKHLILPDEYPPHTRLLDLQPLPVSCLNDPNLQSIYNFSHFNPVQTQVFHTLYHTDQNVLLGAPTGSGKTVVAELAIFRAFREHPKTKSVYIAPLKALVKERIADWKNRLESRLGKHVIELTGDVAPDMRAIERADVIVTTPEKWDGISRSWQNRRYVQSVSLVVIDEIHLLGADRGPILEVIVSRLNFISAHTTHNVRVVGLSTALANAHDLASWLGIRQSGLFNFRPSVRPVPLQIHVQGFPGKAYCPRMASMNKPTFQAIRTHSPTKPTLVFVASRRQTRLTALDLISYVSAEENPKQWLSMPENDVDDIIATLHDENLKLVLSFGIGMHHAGLHEKDRKIVEELFLNRKIQVLVATSTLAWGVNMPAHLVVIKGTEFFDGKLKRYVDFPITDVMQMMGRAGRPQFDSEAVAVVFVQDVKKHFYKKFMFEPFPVESSLQDVLCDHFNAEIVAGTICSRQDAVDYLTWTYFFRRLVMNPTYYGLYPEADKKVEQKIVDDYLSRLVNDAILDLEESQCITISETGDIEPATPGCISSYYYLNHLTIRDFTNELVDNMSVHEILQVLSDANEFAELPVRHNEEILNEELSKKCPLPCTGSFESAHTKAFLLLQAHLSRISLPITDYKTDTKSVLDQCVRVLQAIVDLAADQGWLGTALNTMHTVQMLHQARWHHESTLLTLPHIDEHGAQIIRSKLGLSHIPELLHMTASDRNSKLRSVLEQFLQKKQASQVLKTISALPIVHVSFKIGKTFQSGAIRLKADEEYSLEVKILTASRGPLEVSLPKFPKPVRESWWLILGELESGELLAMKRVTLQSKQSQNALSFFTPEVKGEYKLGLYLVSDCYMGLDQQFQFEVNVESC
eukprot:m.206766 g.206766  ORF g.206766 m.206766 type:complete len:2137 (+) comp15799_c0_seq4:40-6450(+)